VYQTFAPISGRDAVPPERTAGRHTRGPARESAAVRRNKTSSPTAAGASDSRQAALARPNARCRPDPRPTRRQRWQRAQWRRGAEMKGRGAVRSAGRSHSRHERCYAGASGTASGRSHTSRHACARGLHREAHAQKLTDDITGQTSHTRAPRAPAGTSTGSDAADATSASKSGSGGDGSGMPEGSCWRGRRQCIP